MTLEPSSAPPAMDRSVGAREVLAVGLPEIAAHLFETGWRIESDDVERAEHLAVLDDRAVLADGHGAGVGVDGDRAAGAQHRHAVVRDQLAGAVEAEATVARIGRAVRRLHREEALALDRGVERVAGVFERAGRHVALQLPGVDEGNAVGQVGCCCRPLTEFTHDKMLGLEAGRGHVGEVVRRGVHPLVQHLLRGKTDRE